MGRPHLSKGLREAGAGIFFLLCSLTHAWHLEQYRACSVRGRMSEGMRVWGRLINFLIKLLIFILR